MTAKHFAIVMLALLIVIMAFIACQSKSFVYERSEMTHYHATPYETNVEWIVDFKDTAQIALNCEIVLISVEKLENGKMKLSLKAKTP